MQNDLLQRFRAYVARMELPHTPDDVKLWDDIERAILIASTVEPHLPAVRSATPQVMPHGRRATNSPEFETVGGNLVRALAEIAHADDRAQPDGSPRS